jgi:hypothetical protein
LFKKILLQKIKAGMIINRRIMMKRKIDRAWSVTIAELRQNQSDLEEAIRLCEKHRKSFFFTVTECVTGNIMKE